MSNCTGFRVTKHRFASVLFLFFTADYFAWIEFGEISLKIGDRFEKLGTTMIEWSLEKATMVDRSRMHFACYNFEN